jgi:hypothetical protein
MLKRIAQDAAAVCAEIEKNDLRHKLSMLERWLSAELGQATPAGSEAGTEQLARGVTDLEFESKDRIAAAWRGKYLRDNTRSSRTST